ncbi:MAG: hypothetical protein RLZZ369_1722 [Pseudomonadota bacterium]|jgi:hypothetical protein
MSDEKKLTEETRVLAAMAYGEGSTDDNEKEMYALASVLRRQQLARGYASIKEFGIKDKSFSFVTNDGNDRYKKLMKATEAQINKDPGMSTAVNAAKNAFAGGTDYSNGAYFWDGADIKTNYKKHFKVRHGIKFTEPAHNIYEIKESTITTTNLYKTTKKRVNGKVVTEKTLIDSADHVYDSTAAHGGTIFWKQSPHYLNVTKSKEWL